MHLVNSEVPSPPAFDMICMLATHTSLVPALSVCLTLMVCSLIRPGSILLDWRENKIIDQNTDAYEQLRETKLNSDVQEKYDEKRASYASKYQRVAEEEL